MLTRELRHIAMDVYQAIDTPVSLSCFLLAKYGEDAALLERTVRPESYACHHAFLRDTAACSLLRKVETRVSGLSPEDAASATWEECERLCFKTNRRLNETFSGDDFASPPHNPRLDNFVKRARGWVSRLMGSTPRNPKGRVGPGTTMSDRFGRTHVTEKFASTPTLAEHSLGLLTVWSDRWSDAVQQRGGSVDVVRGNQYFQVPKTASTHRSCAKEPSLNVYFQLGLGQQIRASLKSCGIDLEAAQDLHKRLACTASRDGSYATIDLSSASDTVSHATVKLLVPPKWYAALDQCRSRRTIKDGRVRHLEKFSSMGNGFTFELETVLFFSIICSVSPQLIPGVNAFVFGDDIIVPTEFARDVVAALSFWGFTPNEKKTFTRGAFRESCGGDYWLGEDVRPIFVKRSPNASEAYISLHNQLRVLSSRISDPACQRRLADVCDRLRACVPHSVSRCLGPPGLGDICFHCDTQEWRFKWEHGIRYIRTYVPVVRPGRFFDEFDSSVQIAAALYGTSLVSGMRIPGVSGYRLDWTAWS